MRSGGALSGDRIYLKILLGKGGFIGLEAKLSFIVLQKLNSLPPLNDTAKGIVMAESYYFT